MKSIINKLRNSETAQGTVEYILVIVVVVGVILGTLYQFNQAFARWAEGYFGDYIACLLETGELPGLGGVDTTGGECNKSFKPFSLADGRPFEGISGEGGEGAGEGDENSGDEDSGKSSTSSGGGSGSSRDGSSFSSFGRGRPSRIPIRPSGSGEEEDSGEKKNSSGGNVTTLEGYKDGRAVRMPVRDYGDFAGGRGKRKKLDERDNRTKVTNVAKGNIQRSGPQLIAVQRNLASNVEEPDVDGFSFGKLFKYLILAIIILVIIITVGSQVLRISKSMD